ncbi:MAG: Smr/MutS family protein [Sphingorhabdus sp.]
MPRRLNEQEKALWGRVIASVQPMHVAKPKVEVKEPPKPPRAPAQAGVLAVKAPIVPSKRPPLQEYKLAKTPANNLDGHWDRRIDKGAIIPDVSVDLHGSGLSGAYARLDGALEQAIAQKMKVVLLVTGKARTHNRATGEGRGAIASVVRDWLAASRHSASIAAVRAAHPRHGGAGALYIILKS